MVITGADNSDVKGTDKMIYDFTPQLIEGEQILWQGESHRDGPHADPHQTSMLRIGGFVWILIMLLISALMLLANDFDVTREPSTFVTLAIFLCIGIGLIIGSFYYKHEYYCLTDKRIIRLNSKRGTKHVYHLEILRRAKLMGTKNGYGSIMVRGLVIRAYHNNEYRTRRRRITFYLRGVEKYSECYSILTSLLGND